jgi:uncharacterized protein (TIGR02996 family)
MDPALRDTLRKLDQLHRAQAWAELSTEAQAAAARFPDAPDLCAYAAHAMRQLGELEDGYRWAVRGTAIDPQHLFSINRVSLLANLTGRFPEAYDAARSQLDRVVDTAGDAQNLAVTIVNAIYAASRLDRVAEAVELFTPVIVRLDHPELHYNSACLYALAADERAYTYVAKSLGAGKAKTAFDDSDFDAIRADPRFVELLARDWAAEAGALSRSHKATRAELSPEDFVDPQVLRTVDPGAVADTERDAPLEQAIEAAPDDAAGYLVYSDWFQERQNPLGWFVLASRRCDDAATEGERMLAYVDWAAQVHRHAGRWFGPFAQQLGHASRATWRHGFVRELVFDVGYSWRKRRGDVGRLLTDTLALPMLRFLRDLRVGDIWANDELDYAPVVDALAAATLPCLRGLEIAPNDYQMSWTHLDATGLAARLPALESLVLGAGELVLGDLVLPRLRRFAARTGGLATASLASICGARWPELEDLEIWFGSTEYGGDDFSTRELAPILGGRGLGRLRRLALRNAEFTDAICEALVGAPIVAQLAALDLSMGTMGADGAAVLASNAPVFAHLAKLSVADNALPAEAGAMLQRALPQVELGTQKASRYVSVSE